MTQIGAARASPGSPAAGEAEIGSSTRIAVIIPCFNVGRHIEGVIRGIPAQFAPIICVDDASVDDTVPVIRSINDSRVVLVRHEVNKGVGGAMISGYREAIARGAQVCVKMDGDGQMSADDLPALTAPILAGSADYTKGNRFVDRSRLRAMPAARLFGNAVLSFVTKLASGYWRVLDPTNGYTAAHVDMLGRVPLNQLSTRYFFESSILIELNILGARVVDVSLPARYGDERSSLRISRVLGTFPVLLLRGMLRRFYWRYLILDFNVLSICVLLGIPLCTFGVIFGGYHWWHSTHTGQPATAGTVIVAALPIILGFQLLLCASVLDTLSEPRPDLWD